MFTVDLSLKDKIDKRITEHRNRFYRIIQNRYMELLPLCISYSSTTVNNIDFIKMEIALRNGYHAVIGKTSTDKIMFLGYIRSNLSINNPENFFSYKLLTEKDIFFTIPKAFRLEKMQEITDLDGCTTGDFIVVRNKSLEFCNDYEIIKHYSEELAELSTSRFSLTIQAKLHTVVRGDVNDETINQIISDLYNGSPYIRTTGLFDPEEDIIKIDNNNISANIDSLKNEYQNKISELNNMLGINSLAIDKESGISDVEAKSNTAFVASNANIYIKSRQRSLDMLNTRFGQDILVQYDDNVQSELSEVNINGEQDNYNNNGLSTIGIDK